MLQPRETWLSSTRRRKRRHVIKNLRFFTINSLLLILIGCIAVLPQGLTQFNDDLYIVKPTPALRFSKEDLTTVLLLKNDSDNHGRYINVRPDVGILTSTARTFIQEGVTTKYATQVVGTTLDNGRVYAQYLKKSSRILYGGGLGPSVVTSWIGESSKTDGLLPQSHNDLFEADQQDWQAIDDRLLGQRPDFVGNIDYVDRRESAVPVSMATLAKESQTLSWSLYSSATSATDNYISNVAANKVLSLEDLETYTVKPYYELKSYSDLQTEDLDSSGEAFGRNPKLIYKQIMLGQAKIEDKASLVVKTSESHAFHNLATVTYYGFADFTTVVGDSVIVFSPSTASANINKNAHVTSIKGEATLDLSSLPSPSITTKLIMESQDLIDPTFTQEIAMSSTLDVVFSDFIDTNTKNDFPIINDDKEKATKDNPLLKSSEVKAEEKPIETSTVETIESSSTEASLMLSRPSDEDIFRIFKELANAEGNKMKVEMTSSMTPTDSLEETTNVQRLGGATTIFFEDDPFTNFVEPLKTSSIIKSVTSTTTITTTPSPIKEETTFTELIPEPLLTTTHTITENEETTTTEKAARDTDDSKLTNVVVKEIGANEADVMENCIRTSQVFLTQIHKTITQLATVLVTDPLTSETKSEIREELQPTFDIRPATKYYCIQASKNEEQEALPVSTKIIKQDLNTLKNNPNMADNGNSKEEEEEDNTKTEEISNDSSEEEATTDISYQEATDNSMELPELEHNQKEDFNTEENLGKINENTEEAKINKEEIFNKTEENLEKSEVAENFNKTEENLEKSDEDTEQAKRNKDENLKITEENLEKSYEHTEEAKRIKEENLDKTEEDFDLYTNFEDEDEEEIELIYKTLYTTYTYLTTFFHGESTSISSHTEVVTNVLTSTLAISQTLLPTTATQFTANINDNEINPKTVVSSLLGSTKRYMVPSEVETYIRSEEDMQNENEKEILSGSYEVLDRNKISDLVATFYTTYTYYTTIFSDDETEIMSHTEVVTNLKKTPQTTKAQPTILSTISPTILKQSSPIMTGLPESVIENSHMADYSALTESLSSRAKEEGLKPNIPDLGDLSAITLVTDVRSSSSTGDQQIINHLNSNKSHNLKSMSDQTQQSIFEDQLSSESNTDTDEIIPSATLLLQTSFTTFTYYTTMYSGDKTNVVSRLETMTNMVTEILPASKTISLEEASVPITYFTTFTYWTKLAKEGQITTLSREETITNVVIPSTTMLKGPDMTLESITTTTNIESATTKATTESLVIEELVETPTVDKDMQQNQTAATITPVSASSSPDLKDLLMTTALEPTTYYTTYTYYTTSYEADKTITDSRFETVTNIVTPTITVSQTYVPRTTAASQTLYADTPETDKSRLILYDFKKIIDADGISTLLFTTQIEPTINEEGLLTEVISSTSSLYINEERKNLQTLGTSATITGPDGQSQKQYKTGLVRLIEGTRIANRTTTLYQSHVIGTVIDQRYAQIIESTSSFIFEKVQTSDLNNVNSLIEPTIPTGIENIQVTQPATLLGNNLPNIEGSVGDQSQQQDSGKDLETDIEIEEEHISRTDEKLRFPFQTKKRPYVPQLKPFPNRSRPQFAPKKNSSATIITRSDFTPTITATPALKTTNRFSSTRRGSINPNSNSPLLASPSRRFGRPIKSSASTGSQLNSSAGLFGSSASSASRNRFAFNAASSSAERPGFALSTRRAGAATIRPSFSRPALLSAGYPGNSRLRIKQTATLEKAETASSIENSTLSPSNSQEDEEDSLSQDEEQEEENITESTRRQNNPLLRLRRPLNRPQGFQPTRPQQNIPNNGVTPRRIPIPSRARLSGTATTVTTTTTQRPRPRTFQRPALTDNLQSRNRPLNPLFPSRNIFGAQTPATTTEENIDLAQSEEDTNDNEDDSDYDEEDEEETVDDDSNRRRRSNGKLSKNLIKTKKIRHKREADLSKQNRTNFRNRFRRPKLAVTQQSDEEGNDSIEATVSAPQTVPSQRTRSRFGNRYSGHSATTSMAAATSSLAFNHRAIRPTRPTSTNSIRAQFTLREKDSSTTSTTQKVSTSAKRPAFRRPQPAGGSTTRRLPSSTASSNTASKRRLKTFPSSDSPSLHSRNSVTSRSRSSSNAGRSRSGSSRDSGVRSRGRNTNDYNNDNLIPDNDGTITVTHVTPAEVTIPVVNGMLTEYKKVVTAKSSTELLGPSQYTTVLGTNGQSQLVLVRKDSSVNYNGATEVTKYVLHETPTSTITFTPTTIRGRKTSFSHILPSTVYSVEALVSTVHPQISANAPLANILLSQLLLGNAGLPNNNALLEALGGGLTQPIAGAGPQQPATPVTEYKTRASTYVTTVFEGQSTILPITFQGKKILTTIFDTTAQAITATEFITDTIVTTPTALAQPQPVVNSLLLQQLLLQQHFQQQQLQQQPADSSNPLNAIFQSVPSHLQFGGDSLQELEVSNNIRGSGDLTSEDDDFSSGSLVDLEDKTLQAEAQTHKTGKKKPKKNGKNHKRKHNMESTPAESTVITLYVSGRRPATHETNEHPFQPFDSDYQHSDIDEARYNLATRIMSNGVEVIIASNKTKTLDNKHNDLSSQMSQPIDSNKPTTLAASTIKNQMMILLLSTLSTTMDQESYTQQLHIKLPFHTNHFITKTCLTTYTYCTTYVQEGETTVESREKVISNIATEERIYPKIEPSQTLGVTLTRTPDLAVGIFPTTYLYFNTFMDNSHNFQVMTSEHTVINTITGPEDYIAYLMPTAKATPVLETNTYYNKVTLMQTLKQPTTKYQEPITKINTIEEMLTEVIVTKSLPPARKTSNWATAEIIEKINDLDDIHIYATNTYLTTLTYYTTSLITNFVDESLTEKENIRPISTVFTYQTRIMENVLTDSIPIRLFPTEFVAKMKLELRKQKHQRQVIVTTATLKGGKTIKITAMNIMMASPGTFKTSTLLPVTIKEEPVKIWETDHQSSHLETILENTEFNKENQEIKSNQTQIAQEDNLPFVDNLEQGDHLKIENQISEQPDSLETLSSEQIPNTIEFPKNSTLNENFEFEITTAQPSATHNLIQRLTALRPMFNAMAGLWQNNFAKDGQEGVDLESKPTFNKKQMLNQSSETHPIYIPVQKPFPANSHLDNKMENHQDFIPLSLHIKPPLVNEMALETNDKDNWLRPPFGLTGQQLTSLEGFRQEQPLQNGIIYIHPGEIITANSDVIVGRPNGIEYNHKSSQLNRNREIISHQKPKQNQNPYYQPNMQQTSNIKNPSLLATLASAAATRPLQRLANRGTYRNKELNNKWESQNFALRPFNKPQKTLDDFNKNILKPPPLPNLITIPHNLNSYTLQTQFLKPFSNQAQPATSNLNNNLPAFQNKLIENIPQQSIRDLYHFHEPNKDMKNNEILDIQRIPEVFSTDLKPTHLNYKTYLTTKPSHMPQPNQHSALQIHENTILHQPDFYHEQILPTQTSTNLGTSQDFFNTDKEFSLTSITGMTATPVTRPEALQNHKTNKEIFEIFNTPILETSSKKRQHINLNKNTFSQTIDVNVPPLTFNKDPDYPQQNKPVKGQIQALIYTNQTNYMPLITVPLDKQQVQINLTPYHGISNIIPFAKAKPNHSEYSEKENVNETFPFFYNRNFFKNDQQGKQNQKIPASGNSQPDLDITPRWSPPYITHQISTSQNLKNYEILHKFPPTQMTLATFNTEAEPAPQQNWKAKQKFNNMPMSPKAEQHMEKSTNHESLSEIKENPKEFLKFVITNTEQKDEAKTIYKTKINLNTHRAEVDNADDKKNQKLFKHQDEPAKLEKFQTTATLNRYPEDLKNNFATTTATLSRHPEDLKNNFKTTTATLSIHPEDLKNHFATATAFNKEIFNQKNDSIRMWRPKQTQKASINTHSKQKQKTNEITNKINQQYQENFQSTSTSHSLSISIKSPPTNKKLSLNTDALKKEFEKPVPNRSQPFRKYSNNEKPNTPHKTVNQSAIFVAAGEAFKKASTEKSETFITELQTNKPKESNNKSQNIKQLNEIDKLPSQPLITTIKTANETASLTNSAQPTIMKNKTLGNFLKFHQKQLPDDQKREPDIKENPLNFLTKTSPVTPKTPNTETIPFQKQHPEKINLTKETDKKTLKLPEIEDPKMPIKEINFSLQPTQSYNNVASTTITSTRLYTKTKSSTTLKANVLTTKIITNKYGNTVTNTATPTLSDKTTTSQAKPTTLYIKTKTTQNPKITRTAVTSMQHTGSRLKEQTFINANIKPTITLKQNLTATEMRSTQMEIPSKSNVIDINHLPYPSIEIVSTNITKDLVQTESLHHLNKDKMENSIFIILGNNKNKSLLKSSIFTQITDTPFEMATDNGEIINESKEIVIDYDDSISFDSIITRDEQPITHVNGKSVLGNPKNINSDDSPSQNHVLLATPLKIPINHNRNMNLNVGNSSCRPECKSTRNEVCTLKDKHWTCICRPGFARMFPDRICKPTYTYALVMHAERVGNYPLQFVKELGDSTTEHFKQLSQLLVNALDRMLMQSDFRDAYHGVHLTQILDDEQNHQGIMAKFLLQLSDNTDEKRLEEVFRKYLRLSNYSIGGTDVYTNKDGVDALAINDFDECLSKQFHDCSNDARCFNLQGTYTCSCREGFADFSDNLIYPGRRCSSEQIGCEYCQYHGKCSVSSSTTNTWKKSNDYIICECFPWYSGAKCHVNLKILLIVLLGVGTILFILLLFCCLITCTKRQKHTTLATSTMTSTNASGSAVGSFHKNSRLATNMLITRVGVELCDSIENGFSSKNKRKKTIKLDKRSMIKDSSSETSQNSLPYALKTRESFAGIYNQTNSLHLSYRQKYSNYRSHTNGNEQHSVLSHQHLDSQDNFTPQQSNSQPLKNNGDTENYYCEQSDRSLTVMIPRAKYHSSVLPKNQLMHVTTDNDLMYVDRNSDLKCNQKQVSSTSSFTQMPSNPGALISAGFEVSAIVSDHANVISSLENNSIDVVCLEPTTTNNSDTSLDPFTSMGIKQDQKYIQIEGRRKLKSNQHGVTDNLEMKTEYNTKTCEKDLIDTMDEWLGNVKLNELSAEARSFGETTVRASTKHLRVCLDGIQSQPLNDEANTMAERDIGSTFLLPHTHLYKPERQESEMSGFDSF